MRKQSQRRIIPPSNAGSALRSRPNQTHRPPQIPPQTRRERRRHPRYCRLVGNRTVDAAVDDAVDDHADAADVDAVADTSDAGCLDHILARTNTNDHWLHTLPQKWQR